MDTIKATKLCYIKVTVIIIFITSITTIFQFIDPQILAMLRRNPEALLAGQWWRIVTPLLVHSDGVLQFIINIIGIGVFGFAAERIFGSSKIIILYLAGGLAGEIIGYIGWDPFGAGASVGWCGILGGLIFWVFKNKNYKSNKIVLIFALYYIAGLIMNALRNYIVGAILFIVVISLQAFTLRQKNKNESTNLLIGLYGICGGLILIFLHDIHGAAIICGVCTAYILTALLMNKTSQIP